MLAMRSGVAAIAIGVLLLVCSVAALPSGDVFKVSTGGYFRLDSITGYASISGNSAWTTSAWVYVPVSFNDFAIFTFGPSGSCNGEAGMGVYTWTSSKALTILACNLDGSQSAKTLAGGWHHVAMSHSTSGTKAYIDGELAFTSTIGLTTYSKIAYIGARTADYNPVTPGTSYLDDLRVWSRALTQEEVRFDMHGGAATANLIGNYDGLVNAANKLVDSAKSNNATAYGTAPTFTTTARCPVASYIASCGLLSCRYVLADARIPLCGPCLRGYSSAVAANLTGYCDLDVPNAPSSPSASTGADGCVDVKVSWPVISAAIESFTFTRLDNGDSSVIVAGAAATETTGSICGLSAGQSYTWRVAATNGAGTGPSVDVSGVAGGPSCGAGSWWATAASCESCAAGTFSTVATGATVCTTCAEGTFSSTGATTCTECQQGKFAAGEGATVCSACAAGTASYRTGATTCMTCWAGYYSAEVGSGSCKDCEFNEFSLSGSTTCTQCAKGKWTTDTGSSTCVGCSAGTYQKEWDGVTSCEDCDINTYSSSVGATACTDCAPGSLAPTKGSSECETPKGCAAGSYAVPPSSKCTQCVAGKYAAAGATACTSCSIGTFSSASGASACDSCPLGTKAPTNGATSCIPCDVGTYAPAGVNGKYCLLCASGRFAAKTGQSACTACATGSYQCSRASSTCSVCAVGRFASTSGRSECAECPTGKYQSQTSATACFSCAAGTYAEAVGKSVCSACAIGTFSGSSKSTCSACAVGTFAATAGSTVCANCAAGKYTASQLSSSCTLCAANTYAASERSTTCIACTPGTTATAGAATCVGTSTARSMLQGN